MRTIYDICEMIFFKINYLKRNHIQIKLKRLCTIALVECNKNEIERMILIKWYWIDIDTVQTNSFRSVQIRRTRNILHDRTIKNFKKILNIYWNYIAMRTIYDIEMVIPSGHRTNQKNQKRTPWRYIVQLRVLGPVSHRAKIEGESAYGLGW